MNVQGIWRLLKKFQRRNFSQVPWQNNHLAEHLHSLCFRGKIEEAVRVLHQLVNTEGAQVSSETCLPLVRACLKLKNYAEGIKAYEQVIMGTVEEDMVLKNNVMLLYSKCGDFEGARRVFDEMHLRNLFSWTAIIDAYFNGGRPDEAYLFYVRMLQEGIRADNFLYPCVLKACATMRGLAQGQRIHADIIRAGFDWDIVVLNSLIDMYVKSARIEDARQIFYGMPIKDGFTWSSMLSGYVQGGWFDCAVNLFREMLNVKVKPSSASLAGILPAFSDSGYLGQGKQVHGLAIVSGFGSDRFAGSALVDMYVKCRSLGNARLVFDRIPERDIVCWNTILQGYSRNDRLVEEIVGEEELSQSTCSYIVSHVRSIQDAAQLIFKLQNAGIRSRSIIRSLLDQRIEYLKDNRMVKEIHGFLLRNEYTTDSSVSSNLIEMYSRFGDVRFARRIFNNIIGKDLDSWTSMIACYSNNELVSEAVQLFDRMHESGVLPNIEIWNAIISGYIRASDFYNALGFLSEMKYSNERPDPDTTKAILPLIARLNSLEHGRQIHCMLIRNDLQMNRFLSCAFIKMYGNCGNVAYSLKLFESITTKDSALWNSVISSLVKNGFLSEAVNTFHAMQETSIKPSIVTWSTLISGYIQNGYYDEGLNYFRHLLLSELKPNPVTVASILPACAQLAVVSHGKAVHSYIARTGIGNYDAYVTNALMDMYVKCGCMLYAEKVFETMEQRDVVSWNIMVQGAIIHGKGEAALALFDQMVEEGVSPDGVTFVGVLSACSHGGLVDKGWNLFNNMIPRYGVVPSGKHYACMVDLLGRAGQFDTVYDFIIQMPLQPTASLWGALLASSKIHENVEMAVYASEHLLELQPENPGNYVLLSNTYASTGRWNDVDHVRKLMTERGIRKMPGCSWVEIKNQVHAFSVESLSSHPEREKVHECLQQLLFCMSEEGYELDMRAFTVDLDE
ncbi:Pentatricopeptide repeat-containing protein [Nymphaea thermarum]|nr:Pentatricopeptide repeat-containing protein [Nymphaea thermarum]